MGRNRDCIVTAGIKATAAHYTARLRQFKLRAAPAGLQQCHSATDGTTKTMDSDIPPTAAASVPPTSPSPPSSPSTLPTPSSQRRGEQNPNTTEKSHAGTRKQVALLVTCLADVMRPSVGMASLRLLQDAGCDVFVPQSQTCCGQVQYNNGDFDNAKTIAQRTIELFEGFDYTVVPSGSCAGMLVQHYGKLLDEDWQERAARFASRVYELTCFLSDVCDYQPPRETRQSGEYAYHDSCAGLRELHIREQPRQLLAKIGIKIKELEQAETCCGFGGTFCAKMPAISAKMADDKLDDLLRSGVTTLAAGDLGCLLALAGRSRRRDLPLHFRHIAEVLVGDTETPSIGSPVANSSVTTRDIKK